MADPSTLARKGLTARLASDDPGPLDDPRQFDLLTPEERKALLEWIFLAVVPAWTPTRRSSYSIKHDFEFGSNGLYLTNGALKGGMLRSGYEPTRDTRDRRNWRWKITPTCPKKYAPETFIGRGWFGIWHKSILVQARFEQLCDAAHEAARQATGGGKHDG